MILIKNTIFNKIEKIRFVKIKNVTNVKLSNCQFLFKTK